MENLSKSIKVVAELRQKQAKVKEAIQTSHSEWERDNETLLANQEIYRRLLQEAENTLRLNAIEGYKLDGNKAPLPSITIKVFDRYEYKEEEALDWALKHSLALSLNTKAFESYVKLNPQGFNFVQVFQEARAQIATDLSKVLENKE